MDALVVESQAVYRELVTAMLKRHGFSRVKHACDSAEALREVSSGVFGFALIDLSFDGGGGAVLANAAARPSAVRPKILVTSPIVTEYILLQISRVPARVALIDKHNETLAGLRHTVNSVLVEKDIPIRPRRCGNERMLCRILTPRDEDLLHYLAQGCTDADISSKMQLSRRTVEGRKALLLDKLQMTCSHELVQFSRSQGFHLFSRHRSRSADS